MTAFENLNPVLKGFDVFCCEHVGYLKKGQVKFIHDVRERRCSYQLFGGLVGLFAMRDKVLFGSLYVE